VGEARAQVDNRAFTEPEPGRKNWEILPITEAMEGIDAHVEPQAGNVKLAVRAFTFFKDNEYFNKIVDGYTLFGTQLNLQLVYYPTEGLRLEAGVFLWKDFGNPVLQQVRPTYRATWTVNKHQFILGNILPNLSHNYIEPLFNFERVMLKPLEEGLQYRYLGNRLFLDVWVDWLRQQYRYSNYQEEIAVASAAATTLAAATAAVRLQYRFNSRPSITGGRLIRSEGLCKLYSTKPWVLKSGAHWEIQKSRPRASTATC